MRSSDEHFEYRAKFVFAFAAITAFILLATTWKVSNDSAAADNHVSHTREVLDAINQIRISTLSIEYSTQGFRFTGDLARLDERDVASVERMKSLARLASLTASSSQQREHFASLQEVLQQRMAIAKRIEELVRSKGTQIANNYVRTVPLQETRERVYRILGAMEAQERLTLEADRNAQASARSRMLAMSLSVASLLLLVLLTNYYMVRRQFQRLRVRQKELAASEGNLSITLQSIGDGVVATDTRARVTRMNTMAEQFTGWPAELALGRHINDVMQTVDEMTGQPVVVPVTEVLVTGQFRMQASHTILLARDGSERRIAQSVAPIYDVAHQIQGAVLVFHDKTAEYQAEKTIQLQNELLEKRVNERTRQLQDSEERYRTAFMTSPEPIILTLLNDGKYMDVNVGFERTFGWSRSETIGKTSLELGIWSHLEDREKFIRVIHERGGVEDHETEFLTKQGLVVTSLVSAKVISIDGQNCILTVVRDISERKRAVAKLQLAANVFAHAREAIIIADAHCTIVDINESFTRYTGFTREEAIGQNPRILKSSRQDKAFYDAMWGELTVQGHWIGEIWNRRKNGEIYAALLTISAMRNDQGRVHQYVALYSDITAIKQHQGQLEHIAHFDALTNLPNRLLLADRLQQAMAQSLRRGKKIAVAYLDLDGFKNVNDRYGHDIGDKLLVHLATVTNDTLRDGDTLARLGGDEFVAVLIDLDGVESCLPLLTRLLEAAAAPMILDNVVVQSSASIGVTFYPQDPDVEADQLLRQADQALYHAKLAGKNRYHLFDAVHDKNLRVHNESLLRISLALSQGEFVLHYQPKVDMYGGTVIGAEALIRWQHPEKGLLPPAVFLPVIEDHPLAVEVGEWVIETALTQLEVWHAEGLNLTVSVNIGARQLQQGDFSLRLQAILAKHPKVKPAFLEIEVLETSALEDILQVSQVIEDCQQIGVRFALDDFGTGYSSLTYLKRLHVAMLKIDQSFVHDMLEDADDLTILEGIIGLATAFKREVIAEGVETVAHGTALLHLGCALAQGFGIARPMPGEMMHAWVRSWQPDEAWRAARS
jgi:diguanylate cyclase (GGDEF)-like protein/PAS domain S-box-containing protein